MVNFSPIASEIAYRFVIFIQKFGFLGGLTYIEFALDPISYINEII